MPSQFTNLVDVVIVLIGLYIALSTVCSFLNEQLATFLRLRGKKLYLGVANLVSSKTLANAIFNHPLIDPSVNDKGGIQDPPGAPNRPSYVAPHNFAVAFWDALANASEPLYPADARAVQAVKDAQNAVDLDPAAAPRLQAANELLARRTAATPVAGTGVLSDAAHFEDLRQVVEALPVSPLKANALQLLALAQETYTSLLCVTETWFDRQMQAVSGWYTRQARYIVMLLAVLVVFLTGLDTLEIAQRLYTTPAIVSVAANAIMSADRGTSGSNQAVNPAVTNAALSVLKGSDFRQFFHPCLEIFPGPCWISAANADIDATDRERDATSLAIATIADRDAKEKLAEDRDSLVKANCALESTESGAAQTSLAADRSAWLKAQCGGNASPPKPGENAHAAAQSAATALLKSVGEDEAAAQTSSDSLQAAQRAYYAHEPASAHLLGWFITLLAISLGAPFWFDVLNKIVNVRNAGVKPSTQTST